MQILPCFFIFCTFCFKTGQILSMYFVAHRVSLVILTALMPVPLWSPCQLTLNSMTFYFSLSFSSLQHIQPAYITLKLLVILSDYIKRNYFPYYYCRWLFVNRTSKFTSYKSFSVTSILTQHKSSTSTA